VHMPILPLPEAHSKKQDLPAPLFLQIFTNGP